MILTTDINIENLSKGSHTSILCKCDICDREKNMEYRTYFKLTKCLKEKYYCKKCSYQKSIITNRQKYGYDHPQQSEVVKQKTVETNIERYGVKHPSELEECKIKMVITNEQRYGVSYVQQNKDIRRKSINTMVKKYGVEYPAQSEVFLNKTKNTNIEKYGYDNPMKNEFIKQKSYQTSLVNYGEIYPMRNIDIKLKTNQTKEKKLFDKYKNTNLISYNINDKVITYKCSNNHTCKIDYSTFINRLKLKTEICTICNPIGSFSNSGYEVQLRKYIKTIYDGEITYNVKNILKQQEIDIYIPELKLGFEFNGLFWHSEYNLPKDYHLNKTEECEKNGIKLIHIFEDDWLYKNEIIKSKISNILGKNSKINIEECEIKEISDNGTIKDFLEENHLKGFVDSKYKIGLFYNNVMMSIMTFGNLRKKIEQTNIANKYEMLRFCSLKNMNIDTSAEHLLNYFIKKYNPIEIIGYDDRSWSDPQLYNKLGFIFVCTTKPDYYYIVDGKRIHRHMFNKNILIKRYPKLSDKTEHEIILEKKIFRIYDSGKSKYKLILTNFNY